MTSKHLLKANYAVEAKFDAYFTGQRIQVTKDGGTLLCECGDSVGIVSVTTGQVTEKITCEEDQVTAISLSPNNESFVIALKSTSIQQYQWPSKELQRSFKSYHRGPVMVMAWDMSSTLLATGGADSSARVWDLNQKYCTHSLKGASGVFGAILFDRDLVKRPRVYGGVSNTVHIWKLEAGSSEVIASMEGHHAAVTALELTHDNQKLVSCGLDRVIIVWDLESFQSIKILPIYESLSDIILQPPGVVFPGAQDDPQHIYALVVGDKGIPSVWQVESGVEVWKASNPLVTPPDQEGVTLVNQMLYCPTLDSVIVTTYDHSILFAKTDTMTLWKQLAGYNDQILDAIFIGTNDSHLVVATNSIQLRIYTRKTFSCQLLTGHTALVLALAKHPTQSNIFASSSHDNSIIMWCLTEDELAVPIVRAEGHTQSIGCIALAQGFLVSGSRDMCLKRWSVDSIIENSRTSQSTMQTLSSTHTEKAHDKDINSVCVSINNKLIATGSQDKTAKIWDADNLTLLGTLNGHRRGVWCVQFSPVDEVLATASADATIKLWAISDLSLAATFEGHDVSVLRVSWLNHGLQLLSTGSDGLLKLWTVKTRQCVNTFDEHDDRTWALAVTRDESAIVTGGEDATLVMWKDVTQEEKDKALEEASRLASEEQALLNLIQDKKWAKALGIAIRLNQPFRALKVMKALLDETPSQLSAVLKRLRKDQISTLLEFATQWNTKTKNCRESQRILNILLREQLPDELEGLSNWSTTLEGLLPYTERHLKRLSALNQSSAILQYMSASISLGDQSSKLTLPKVLDEVELLKNIGVDDEQEKYEAETENLANNSESESDNENESNELLAAVKNSIMEVDDEEETDDEDEDEEEERESTRLNVAPVSLDDLDANYTIENVTIESSDEEAVLSEEGENVDPQNTDQQNQTKKKRQDHSIETLTLESKKKKVSSENRKNGISKNNKGKKMGRKGKGKFTSIKR